MSAYDTLLYDVTDGVAVITFNRHEARNALSRAALADLRAALSVAREDDSIGAVVFTGAGEKAFVAGADISQLRSSSLHTGSSRRCSAPSTRWSRSRSRRSPQ
ncbi:enoyl-CoA hydratase-related protein [Rhodococcus sp. NCIMB 12038]|uniref:enoyl-CoA hydratase-related protein n=1 Tax=Rhodococcus sp. NCIMB 12038 TaxID=933800 RepID=UPI00211ABAEC|nr:enoyl-CoA hydratase-related protein [Rhodococcus sp. NCIMB 12038]